VREATYDTIKVQTVVKQKTRVYAMNDNRLKREIMSLEEATVSNGCMIRRIHTGNSLR
jgi:hypothetical protein